MQRTAWTLAALAACAVAFATAQEPAAPTGDVDVDELLASMSLEEKVGQLFVIGANAPYLHESTAEHRRLVHLVSERRVGGVIWYRSKVMETAVLAAKLQAMSKIPLLFACDLEAGMGMRFDDTSWAPSAMAVAATGEPSLAEKLGRATAEEARALGIQQIYAPVADVNINAENPVINTRSFGEDPKQVARFVIAFSRGIEQGGGLATLKHFPGHGDTAVDSHRALPVLRVDRARLDAVELAPFREAFLSGWGRSVMVAHLAVPSLDDTPAPLRADAKKTQYQDSEHSSEISEAEREKRGTLPATVSPKIATDLLRKQMLFDGLVVTDALDMGGLADHFDPAEGAIRALLAGADVLLKSDDPDAAIDGIVNAVKSGRVAQAKLDASVKRILREKARLELFDPEKAMPDLLNISKQVGRPETDALYDEIARRSLTLVREAPGSLPLDPAARLLHVTACDDSTSTASVLQAALAKRSKGGARTLRLDPRTSEEEASRAVGLAKSSDVIVLSLTMRTRSGAGKIEVPKAVQSALDGILACGKPVVAVSLGSPYLIRDLKNLPTYLASYSGCDASQRAVAAALYGESAIQGTLPVTIPGIAKIGEGIRKERQR